jgi:hypothetical protein
MLSGEHDMFLYDVDLVFAEATLLHESGVFSG